MNVKLKLDRNIWPLVALFTIDGKESSYRATMVAGEGWTLYDGESQVAKNPQLGELRHEVLRHEEEKAVKAIADAAAAQAIADAAAAEPEASVNEHAMGDSK